MLRKDTENEITKSMDLRISIQNESDDNAEFNGINLNPEEKQKYQTMFDETFARIITPQNPNILEDVKQCITYTGYNISITSQHIEVALTIALQIERGSELYDLLMKFAARFLETRLKKVPEIIDFELLPSIMQLLTQPLSQGEKFFFKFLFFSSIEVIRCLQEKFHFLDIIIETLRNPSTTEQQFLDLMEIVIYFLSLKDTECEYDEIQFQFFENVIKPFIFSENDRIFGAMVDLLQSTIECTTKNEIYYFICSEIPVEGAPPQLFLDYLLNRLTKESPIGLQEIVKENILKILLNATATSLECAKVFTFEQGIIEKFTAIVPSLSEKAIVIIIGILQNLIDPELGIESVSLIAQSGFIDVALNLLQTGSYKAKEGCILFFCEFSKYASEEQIATFLVEKDLVNHLIEFIDVKDNPKTWNSIILALNALRDIAYAMGASEANLFTHPFFQPIDVEEFSRLLYHMDDFLESMKGKEGKYKLLLSYVREYCEIMENSDLI